MRKLIFIFPIAACAVAVSVLVIAGAAGATKVKAAPRAASSVSALTSRIAALRGLKTASDDLPPAVQDVAERFAASAGFVPDVIRHVADTDRESLYLVAGLLKGIPTACVMSPQPNGQVSASCNTAAATLKGQLVGAHAWQDGVTTVFAVVPDGAPSPLTVAGKSVPIRRNIAVTTADAGAPMTYLDAGKIVRSVVAGVPRGRR